MNHCGFVPLCLLSVCGWVPIVAPVSIVLAVSYPVSWNEGIESVCKFDVVCCRYYLL